VSRCRTVLPQRPLPNKSLGCLCRWRGAPCRLACDLLATFGRHRPHAACRTHRGLTRRSVGRQGTGAPPRPRDLGLRWLPLGRPRRSRAGPSTAHGRRGAVWLACQTSEGSPWSRARRSLSSPVIGCVVASVPAAVVLTWVDVGRTVTIIGGGSIRSAGSGPLACC